MSHTRPVKRRRLSPSPGQALTETTRPSDRLSSAASWDLEEKYAQQSRKNKNKKESSRLPVYTTDGVIKNVADPVESPDDSDSFLGSESIDEIDGREDTPLTDPVDDGPKITLHQQIVQAKEEIARLAGLLNEDPEGHVGSFKKLAQIAGPDAHTTIRKIGLAAQAAVYKDVIPGYRIRAYKDEEMGTQVSKDLRRTRQYEHALISGYQSYVKQLATITRDRTAGDGDALSLKTVALGCAGNLLLSVPHFNCRTELLNILVHELTSKKPTPDFLKAVSTLEQLFEEDEDGAPSLEAVTIMAKMLKAKDYRIREEVLNTLMHLRLLSELSVKASTTQTEKEEDVNKLHGRKVKKQKQEHRSKKERKVMRERKAVAKDMREANAAVDHEAREKMQSETLKVVFVMYFRILKARNPELMGAVLEGLAKYAHLINQDFFGDLLEALKDIVSQTEVGELLQMDDVASIEPANDDGDHNDNDDVDMRNAVRQSLLSAQTAFTLLSHQETSKSASALQLDLSFFTNHIYRTLHPLSLSADLELGPKSLHLPDPHNHSHNQNHKGENSSIRPDPKINVSTPVVLLSRVLTAILLTPVAGANTSPQLIASFTKRLLTCVLHTPDKSSQSLLTLLLKLTRKHPRKLEPLWYTDERRGDGVYCGHADSIDATRVWSVGSGVWEGELLRRHWSPEVRGMWADMEKEMVSLASKG